MGVSELFHIRRFWRRGRRVADGSRRFVIGLDKSLAEGGANNSIGKGGDGTRAQATLPNGRHFVVSYDRTDGVALTTEEQDICNNNDDTAQQVDYYLAPSFDPSPPVSPSSFQFTHGESVVFALIPEESSAYHAANSIAVVTTTELKEVKLFASTTSLESN